MDSWFSPDSVFLFSFDQTPEPLDFTFFCFPAHGGTDSSGPDDLRQKWSRLWRKGQTGTGFLSTVCLIPSRSVILFINTAFCVFSLTADRGDGENPRRVHGGPSRLQRRCKQSHSFSPGEHLWHSKALFSLNQHINTHVVTIMSKTGCNVVHFKRNKQKWHYSNMTSPLIYRVMLCKVSY